MARSQLDIILKVTDKASRQIGDVESKIGKLGKIAGLGLAAAGAAIVGIGAAAVSLARDSAAVPGITAAFEALAATVDGGADAMLGALNRASHGMVSNTELMRQFNLANQLVGDDFAERLPDAMQYLGKVSAATGEDMGFLMDSLIRGVGRLSPMILDNLGIQVDMNGAYEAYAESIGKTTSELTKSEQQTAVMNAVMEQLATNTAAMPEVAGTAAQQFATFSATLQNAKDSIGVALLPALQQLVTELTPLIEQYGPQVALWIGEKLPIAVQTLATFMSTKLIPFIKKVGDGFAAWKNIINALPAVFAAIKTKVVNFLNAIKDAMPDWLIPGSPTPLELGLKGIKSALDEVGPNIAGLNQDQRSFFSGSTVNVNNGVGLDAFESVLRGLT